MLLTAPINLGKNVNSKKYNFPSNFIKLHLKITSVCFYKLKNISSIDSTTYTHIYHAQTFWLDTMVTMEPPTSQIRASVSLLPIERKQTVSAWAHSSIQEHYFIWKMLVTSHQVSYTNQATQRTAATLSVHESCAVAIMISFVWYTRWIHLLQEVSCNFGREFTYVPVSNMTTIYKYLKFFRATGSIIVSKVRRTRHVLTASK